MVVTAEAECSEVRAPVPTPGGVLPINPPSAPHGMPKVWLLAAVLAGLTLVEGFHEGGFWRPDALVATCVSGGVLALALALVRLDAWSRIVVASFMCLAAWWLVRSLGTHSASSFLPFGASMLGFVTAFVCVSALGFHQRQLAAQAIAGAGAIAALVGFVGLIWRWYPMAMPSQGLWRLSSTLTYADAIGALLALCLLLALATRPEFWAMRVAVCLCAGGLIATQSRGPILALVCATLFVPLGRYRLFLVPLATGVALGATAVASSGAVGGVPLLCVVLVACVGIAMFVRPVFLSGVLRWRRPIVVVSVVICALVVTAVLLRHQIELRVLAPSNGDRAVEWSAGFRQFSASPWVGVGPDRILQFRAPDGTYAHFVHNEYLQLAADCGLIGVGFLVVAGVSLFRVARRTDVLSSCAVAALVCLAVVGGVDFDWHIPAIGLLGGAIAGLTTRRLT